jgi:hypothetical protein
MPNVIGAHMRRDRLRSAPSHLGGPHLSILNDDRALRSLVDREVRAAGATRRRRLQRDLEEAVGDVACGRHLVLFDLRLMLPLKVGRHLDTLRAASEPSAASSTREVFMKEPGLDHRHRDKDGTIQQKRSDTKNKNLSPPIPGFGPETTLGAMRNKTGKTSEKEIRAAMKKK